MSGNFPTPKTMTEDKYTTASPAMASIDSKVPDETIELVEDIIGNLEYNNDEEEPEIHLRTYIVIAALCMSAFTALFTVQGPSAVLTQISEDLGNTVAITWVAASMTVPQAVLAPILCSAADSFQIRKWLIVVLNLIGVVGAAIAPGSSSVYRLIAAQTLVGFAFIATPLVSVIPSEILPRKWRPMAQAMFNLSAMCGAVSGPLIMGGLVKANPHTGWRTYFWIETGVFALAALTVVIGYRPPVRHTKYDHLSWLQKIAQLDLVGCVLFALGLTLFLVGIGLGGGLFAWKSATVLSTLIIGICALIAFGVYEWKGTQTGILHHELFRGRAGRGRTFAILLSLMLVEGILMFAFVVFFPILTTHLYASDTVLIVSRSLPFYVAALLSTVMWGYVSTKLRTIRETLLAGFVFFTAGTVGLATLQPSSSTNSIIFAAVTGIGFGAPIVLINAGVQLAAPHHLIATATAVTFSTRSVGASIFTTLFGVALNNRLHEKTPAYIAEAAAKAGLPAHSIPAFIAALAGNDQAALAKVPGVTGTIIAAGLVALRQAFADSVRVVYIIAAPFGIAACIGCLFLGSVAKTMNYHVDAPVEELHAKQKGQERELSTAA